MKSKKLPKRKTKIVATLGPASSTPETVRALIEAGMNVARLNFSHGTHEDHSRVLELVRQEAAALGAFVAVFQDLCGPKIRIGPVEGDEVMLLDGTRIALRYAHKDGDTKKLGTTKLLYVEAFNPVEVMRPGEKALLADGRVELVAEEVAEAEVICVVTDGGAVRSRCGISVPESKLTLPCLTDKDRKDLEWAVRSEVDYVALSFVSSAKDVFEVRDQIRKLGGSIPIISKIERAAALDNLAEIITASDAVMVARGDLGLELPLQRVPGAQKLIIEQANYHGTPVITATQMLQSMVNEARPTRAEVSDVYTAIKDGTDAVMLSEETAIGKHPVLVIDVLDKIINEAEKEFEFEEYRPRLKGSDRETIADAICYAACGAANKVTASAILACTQSGYTARLVAKYRPQQTLFGATSTKKTLARMALYWGVEPIFFSLKGEVSTEDEVLQSMVAARDQYGIKPGSRVVVTAGLKAGKSGTTTLMEIREVPRTL